MRRPSTTMRLEHFLVDVNHWCQGHIVFMENLSIHKVKGVAEAIEAVGATVRYLPAYSPDLNPIEQSFAKLKAALRKGAARTVEALWKLIGKLLKTFAPDECANYFRSAG
jgi:transposase